MSDQQQGKVEGKIESHQDEVEAHKFDQQQEGRSDDQQEHDDEVEAHLGRLESPKSE